MEAQYSYNPKLNPAIYPPTKKGYKAYVKEGGNLSLPAFQVYERRSERQIIEDDITRFYNAMNYALEMACYYESVGDLEQSDLRYYTYNVRRKQYMEQVKKLNQLSLV